MIIKLNELPLARKDLSPTIILFLLSTILLSFRNARRKMCPDSADKPSVIKERAGLFWLEKTETVQDEKVDGDYGLIINGHSLVRGPIQTHFHFHTINRLKISSKV